MRKDSPRWVEISRSEYDHERAGLDALGDLLPDAAPYRLWTNFEFQDSQGTWNEVDALVLGRGRLHLLELKSWGGIIRGDEHNWNITGESGRASHRKSPTLATRRSKACFTGDGFFHITSAFSVGPGDFDDCIGAHPSQLCHLHLGRYRFPECETTRVVFIEFEQDPCPAYLLGWEGSGADSGG